jgi:hypothetical protein
MKITLFLLLIATLIAASHLRPSRRETISRERGLTV